MLEKLNKNNEKEIEYLKPIIIDINGRPRGLILKKDPKNYNGICFDGSSIKGHAPIEESDLIAKPDQKTIKTIDVYGKRIGLAICDIESTQGKPYLKNTRMKLKNNIKELERKDIKFKVGVEIEYFIVKKRENIMPYDQDQYFEIAPYTKSERIQLKIMEKLLSVGIDVEKVHHEFAEGQYEFAIKASDPITTADNIILSKILIKDAVKRYGLEATFMPKPFKDMNGSGMHIHLSILDNENRNLFYDEGSGNLSRMAIYAIGGILRHSREISLIVAPTVNSYKRLKPGYEAPNRICWGYGNRSTLIRVPNLINKDLCRIEYRHPDPSCNPYLAILVIISAALNGIENNMETEEASKENIYKSEKKYAKLPSNLGEAIEEFERSEFMVNMLGEQIRNEILKIKKIEWMEYMDYITKNRLKEDDITNWEIERYLVKT